MLKSLLYLVQDRSYESLVVVTMSTILPFLHLGYGNFMSAPSLMQVIKKSMRFTVETVGYTWVHEFLGTLDMECPENQIKLTNQKMQLISLFVLSNIFSVDEVQHEEY